MNNKKKIILYIVTGLLFLLVGLGLSYSYFVSNITGIESASTLSGFATTLKLRYVDGSGTISGENIIPGWSASKTFSVQNTGRKEAYYTLYITNINNRFSIPGSISYQINSTDANINTGKQVLPLTSGSVSRNIKINSNTTHNFTITVYYNNLEVDQMDDLGASFSFEVTIKPQIADPWDNPGTGTLLASIKSTGGTVHNDNDSGMTMPGRELATTNEGIRSTTDDYGTSYYYRGAVENNYVVFAGMCWRIVRVDGLGNTKLVLYNYNPNNVSNPCASSEDGDTNAFARVNNSYQSAFNPNDNMNTYVGYMYSNNPDSSDFNTAHANDNDSTILTFLKNWYDEKLRSYNDMLADVIWCNDKSIVTDTTYDPWESQPTGTGLGTDSTYYKSVQRLYPYNNLEYNTNNASPSLVCPNAGSDGKLSKFTARDTINGNAKLYSDGKEYKIGLLTIDEITFAGRKYKRTNDTGNSAYYLYNNATGKWYWSLSPLGFSRTAVFVWDVLDGIFHLSSSVKNANGAVRPAIALKYDTTIASGGTGTSSNPFVVNDN